MAAWRSMMAGLGAVTLVVPAGAKDVAPCAPDMICASAPTTVAARIMKAGYRALLSTDKAGDPKVESTAEGYDWQVFFYDCENHIQCSSIQFYVGFKADPIFTLALANHWNATQRFGTMSVDADGGVSISHDMSTIGGVNHANFDDVISWWTGVIAAFDKFIDQERAARAPAKAAK